MRFRADYERDGFVIARGLFAKHEIAAAIADAERVEREFAYLKDTKNRRCRWQENVFTGDCQFDAFDPIIDLSPAIAKLARDPRLLEFVDSLYGERACLFKDKLIFKYPGAKGYVLHQDWIAWARFPRSFNSLLVPLDPADEANGCTIVYPGYHQNGPLTPPDGSYRELPAASADEVRLRGTFNLPIGAAERATVLKESLRVLKPGGRLFVHVLTGERPVDSPDLPGPASVVRHVPETQDIVKSIESAGLVKLKMLKFGEKPCFVRNNVAMRETQIEAFKP
jgi:SAM-dependent methyltransferase